MGFGPYDVICGRDKQAFNNVGNRRMRVFLTLYLPQYLDSKTRKGKSKIIRTVVETMQAGGGRFLKWNRTEKSFSELSDKEAHAKCSHAFRDMVTARVTVCANNQGTAPKKGRSRSLVSIHGSVANTYSWSPTGAETSATPAIPTRSKVRRALSCPSTMQGSGSDSSSNSSAPPTFSRDGHETEDVLPEDTKQSAENRGGGEPMKGLLLDGPEDEDEWDEEGEYDWTNSKPVSRATPERYGMSMRREPFQAAIAEDGFDPDTLSLPPGNPTTFPASMTMGHSDGANQERLDEQPKLGVPVDSIVFYKDDPMELDEQPEPPNRQGVENVEEICQEETSISPKVIDMMFSSDEHHIDEEEERKLFQDFFTDGIQDAKMDDPPNFAVMEEEDATDIKNEDTFVGANKTDNNSVT